MEGYRHVSIDHLGTVPFCPCGHQEANLPQTGDISREWEGIGKGSKEETVGLAKWSISSCSVISGQQNESVAKKKALLVDNVH